MSFLSTFVLLPLIILYLIVRKIMGTKANNWVTRQATKKSWYNFYFWTSLFSLFFFLLAFGLWVYYVIKNKTDLDNSGMGIIILIPPLFLILISLLASSLARFNYNKKNLTTDNIKFVFIGLLTIPVTFFGLLSFVLTIVFTFNIFMT
jgi:hypothetical protein